MSRFIEFVRLVRQMVGMSQVHVKYFRIYEQGKIKFSDIYIVLYISIELDM